MKDPNPSLDQLLETFKDSTKALQCLFLIEEALNQPEASLSDICESMLHAIPTAMQYPDLCRIRVKVGDETFKSHGFEETPWLHTEEIKQQDKPAGHLIVCYRKEVPLKESGYFLEDEKKLLQTIAERFSHYLMYQKMKKVFRRWNKAKKELSERKKEEWEVALDLLRQTDRDLFLRISIKMLNFLCWSGVRKADHLRRSIAAGEMGFDEELDGHANRPHRKRKNNITTEFAKKISSLAEEYMRPEEILTRIHQWIQEDKLNPLVLALHCHQPLGIVVEALTQHYESNYGVTLPRSYNARGLQVALVRRMLSNQLEFIRIAKNFIEIEDIYNLLKKTIFSNDSQGRIGGKGSGLILSGLILKKNSETCDALKNVKIPKTWFMTSDLMIPFMHFNNLDEIVEQKYKDIQQIRLEYPHLVHTLKNSRFPPDMLHGLSVALDDFKEAPLIVRSSSLLEDRVGAVFSGKYKSLFLANQGTKEERLEALLDAVAEVYASTFGPDPLGYRSERGLLDFKEEMGILIQEVVGTRVGPYYFAFNCQAGCQ
ncbi:MAG: PEP/pyruvate-binding domain-containing protein [Planctomycetota bacterium]